jgi:serine/threonine-protein kinase HipA
MDNSQAYVFITLPATLVPVVCGVVRESTNDFLEFVYAKSYVKNPNAIPIDPIHLPLDDSILYLGKNDYSNIGAIRDAMPDSWGRFLIEKKLRSPKLSEITYMLNSEGERVGALDFSPTIKFENKNNKFYKKNSLQDLLIAVGSIDDPQFESDFYDVLKFGSSMGGARPKTVIETKNALWLAKFNRKNDGISYARLEYANMTLARAAGLDVPEVEILSVNSEDIFLIKRFDREKDLSSAQYYKRHFLSALTVTGRVESDSHLSSYSEIAASIRQISKQPKKDLLELYRRMVFNILCNNSDDHLKNHGFLHDGNGYRLSPAYDIVPSITKSYTKYLTLIVGRMGKIASLENALSNTESFGISVEEAKTIIREMLEKIKNWSDIFSKCGIDHDLIKLLSDPETGAFKNTLPNTG